MLEALITSKTRIKLMLKFFLNINSTGYLRSLEPEFGESTNAIRQELNRFEAAGLLQTVLEGNKKIYRANITHPLFTDINRLVRKYIGVDDIVEQVISHLGKPEAVYLSGDLAMGNNSRLVELIVVGDHIDQEFLNQGCAKAEKLITRKIQASILTIDDFNKQKDVLLQKKLLLLWKNID
jgi:hypothetical protein